MKKWLTHGFAVMGASVMALFLLGVSPTAAASMTSFVLENPDEIVMDGLATDWPAENQVIDESTTTDVDRDVWCWDPKSSKWDSTIETQEECTSYFWDPNGQWDIQTAYFGVGKEEEEDYMYLLFTTDVAQMAVYDTAEKQYKSIFEVVMSGGDAPTDIPQDYHYAMIFAFGSPDAEGFEYYLVAEMNMDSDIQSLMPEMPEFGPSYFMQAQEEIGGVENLKIYQETNGTKNWQTDDTLVDTIDTADAETNMDDMEFEQGTVPPSAFEVQQKLGPFFAATNFIGGEVPEGEDVDYNFAIMVEVFPPDKEATSFSATASSSETLDQTDTVIVNFTTQTADYTPAATVKNLKVKKKLRKRKKATASWKKHGFKTQLKLQKWNKKKKKYKKYKTYLVKKNKKKKLMKKLKPGTKYRVRARKQRTESGTKYYSDWTTWVKFKTAS